MTASASAFPSISVHQCIDESGQCMAFTASTTSEVRPINAIDLMIYARVFLARRKLPYEVEITQIRSLGERLDRQKRHIHYRSAGVKAELLFYEQIFKKQLIFTVMSNARLVEFFCS